MDWLPLLLFIFPVVISQNYGDDPSEWKCPQYWMQFQSACYRFIKSPLRSRNDARLNCQAYGADLVSISSLDEHGFLVYQLLWQDPQHRKWYIGAHQQSPGYWVNDGDGSSLNDLDAAFLPDSPTDLSDIQLQSRLARDYLVYSFSNELKRWGFKKVDGEAMLLYICEVPVSKLHYLVTDDRTYSYGVEITDPERIPRGPYFIKQPTDAVFDVSTRKGANDVTLRCIAGGYPTPTYEWFKEEYEQDQLIPKKIDPLADSRYTISGGSLIIYAPKQVGDRGQFHCKASNEFGTIISESVTLSFGVIGEFNLKRPPESGRENWGKVIYCDPPQHYSSVKYYWNREYFPNFVEENKRIFVSYDGALYFSSMENIDVGNYSCAVQSDVSKTGRNGPFFPLRVEPHANYQQLKFPNNFPKAFPEAPTAGKDVRLECVSFGYPVPSYNWTRVGAQLPRNAIFTSYNRVLVIPRVKVEDQGEYRCRVSNGRASIENSVTLSIQAEPNFTIPLADKHMDNQATLTWTCEAFGIPDVTYSWFRDGELLEIEKLPPEDRDRYLIQDNVLTIKHLDPNRDPAMYQCRARNILKTKYSSAQLRVLSLRPDFKKHPLEPETYAGEGGNVTIVCNPEAAPRPKFTWKKDEIVLGAGGRRRILENGNMVISPVSRDDEGLYTCHASNDYGSDESKGRLIVLRGPSLIEELPPKIVTTIGSNIYLHCKAYTEDILDVAFVWSHNSMSLVSFATLYHKVKVEAGHLEIWNVTFADAGEYECNVKSAVGRVKTKTVVAIEGPPGPPGGVQVAQIGKRKAIIQWTDGATHGREITRYAIAGRTQWSKDWFLISDNVISHEVNRYTGRKEASVEQLTPFSMYEFRVQAGNAIGLGIPSLPSPKYSTQSDKPYKAPDKVGGGGGKIGDLIITWEPLPQEHQNGPGIYYKVFYRRHHPTETEFQTEVYKEMGNIGVAVIRISLDNFYTQYDVKIQAANDNGYGPESNVTIIYSAEDMPQAAPQLVIARKFNSTALNVTWNPIDQSREIARGKLIGHRLKYWKQNNREEDSVYYLSRTIRPWSLIVGLQPNTYYFVKVMAYNSAGEGPESERYLEQTYRKAPQKPPSSVEVYGINPSTVRVTWRYVQPTSEEEPLLGFKVRVWEMDQDMSTANDTIVLVGRQLESIVDNLSPGKGYHLRVLAYSNGGDGRMSSPAVTFQMGEASAYRSRASSHEYYKTLIVSVSLLFLHFNLRDPTDLI
uniref:Contactin n=1 Tax=Lygus hesperus TaxID=30085 RepID=A0A0A9W5Z2_LYGHE